MTVGSERSAVSSKKTGANSMFRKIGFCLPLTLFLLTVAEAQQPMKIPKMGFLLATSPSVSPARVEALRRGLRELGYQEGKNIIIDIATQRENSIVFQRLPLSWCVSKWT
jgi:hypothetical protein